MKVPLNRPRFLFRSLTSVVSVAYSIKRRVETVLLMSQFATYAREVRSDVGR
jgi:hypothetical protein